MPVCPFSYLSHRLSLPVCCQSQIQAVCPYESLSFWIYISQSSVFCLSVSLSPGVCPWYVLSLNHQSVIVSVCMFVCLCIVFIHSNICLYAGLFVTVRAGTANGK